MSMWSISARPPSPVPAAGCWRGSRAPGRNFFPATGRSRKPKPWRTPGSAPAPRTATRNSPAGATRKPRADDRAAHVGNTSSGGLAHRGRRVALGRHRRVVQAAKRQHPARRRHPQRHPGRRGRRHAGAAWAARRRGAPVRVGAVGRRAHEPARIALVVARCQCDRRANSASAASAAASLSSASTSIRHSKVSVTSVARRTHQRAITRPPAPPGRGRPATPECRALPPARPGLPVEGRQRPAARRRGGEDHCLLAREWAPGRPPWKP
jgi:hypothetical protein